MENNTVFLQVGDEILYEKKFCPITQIKADGVMVKLENGQHRFIFATELIERRYEYMILWKTTDFIGRSFTEDYDKAIKEKELMESLNYEVSIKHREVVDWQKNSI